MRTMARPRHNNSVIPGHVWLLWLLLLVVTRTIRSTVAGSSASQQPSRTTNAFCFVPSLHHSKNRRHSNHEDDCSRRIDPWKSPWYASTRRSATTSSVRSILPFTYSTTMTKRTSLWATSKTMGAAPTPKNTTGDSTPPSTLTITNRAETIICGGGPAGLLSAIMLAQKFPNVRSISSRRAFFLLFQGY
jgi:hypothetical protein